MKLNIFVFRASDIFVTMYLYAVQRVEPFELRAMKSYNNRNDLHFMFSNLALADYSAA